MTAAASQIGRLAVPGVAALAAAAVGVLAGAQPAACDPRSARDRVHAHLSNLYLGLVLFIALAFLAEVPCLTGPVSFAKFGGLVLGVPGWRS